MNYLGIEIQHEAIFDKFYFRDPLLKNAHLRGGGTAVRNSLSAAKRRINQIKKLLAEKEQGI